MIDTVVLTLKPDFFKIMDHLKFSPSTRGLFEPPYYTLGNRANFSCFQNPTQEDAKKGIYKPRLTVTKRVGPGGLQITMRIEFSAPKLLFGNNFDEVEEKDFEEITKRLYDRLYEMGVMVFPQVLRDAPISAIHYSKNIALTDYSTPYSILKELRKINLTQKLDLNQTDFRNEGHSLKFRANSFEVSLYDKLKDLEKSKISEKRAVEKDYYIQKNLFEKIRPKKPFEVLRIEIRLNKREKIRQIFGKIAANYTDLTFSQVFKKIISQKVIQHFFDEIKNTYAILPRKPRSWKEFGIDFKMNHPKAKIRKMLQLAGLTAMLNAMGVREFREAMKIYGKHNWDRLRKDLVAYKLASKPAPATVVIEKSIREFRTLKLVDFTDSANRRPITHA